MLHACALPQKAQSSVYQNFVYDTSGLASSVTPSDVATFLEQNGNTQTSSITQTWDECVGTEESWESSSSTTFAFTQTIEVSASVFEIVEASSSSEFAWEETTTDTHSSSRSTSSCRSVSHTMEVEAGKALHAQVTQGKGTANLPWTVSWASTGIHCDIVFMHAQKIKMLHNNFTSVVLYLGQHKIVPRTLITGSAGTCLACSSFACCHQYRMSQLLLPSVPESALLWVISDFTVAYGPEDTSPTSSRHVLKVANSSAPYLSLNAPTLDGLIRICITRVPLKYT
jgi:hypothetical protein